jgi:hypothetical protein
LFLELSQTTKPSQNAKRKTQKRKNHKTLAKKIYSDRLLETQFRLKSFGAPFLKGAKKDSRLFLKATKKNGQRRNGYFTR